MGSTLDNAESSLGGGCGEAVGSCGVEFGEKCKLEKDTSRRSGGDAEGWNVWDSCASREGGGAYREESEMQSVDGDGACFLSVDAIVADLVVSLPRECGGGGCVDGG